MQVDFGAVSGGELRAAAETPLVRLHGGATLVRLQTEGGFGCGCKREALVLLRKISVRLPGESSGAESRGTAFGRFVAARHSRGPCGSRGDLVAIADNSPA